MSTWCLIKSEADAFRKALKNGDVSPEKLVSMTSAERRAYLGKFVGQENASNINSLFESKLLLKNQKQGMINWAKQVAGITPKVRKDMLAKIERMEKILDPKEQEQFLNDLVNTRLGIDVTQEEAKDIADLSKQVSISKNKWNEKIKKNPKWSSDPQSTRKEWVNDKDRLEYGASQVEMEKYLNDLKLKSKSISLREQPVKKISSVLSELPGASKSLIASLDNSFWGRQGIKTLLDPKTTGIWARNFLKSWSDMGKEFKGVDAMDAIKADIYSRPNAINGKYKAGRYGLEALTEEAYPSTLPEKIPAFKRLFKASESAYNGGALRMRADLADRLIAIADKSGVNTLDPEQAKYLGNLVGSLTGRGNLGKAEVISKELNNYFFSIKFLKSNLDTLLSVPRFVAGKTGAQPFKNAGEEVASKESAKSFLRIASAIATILTIAKALDSESVETDPRSNKFGKIKIFGQWTDITGGMGGLVTLASQLTPTQHNGEWGFWKKDSKGDYTNLSSGKFGMPNALDALESFFEGKLSPVAGVLRNIWKGTDFSGQPTSLKKEAVGLITPLPIKDIMDIKSPEASFPLGSIILNGLGLSVSTTPQPNIKSNLIPENKTIKNEDFINSVKNYAEAIGTDPETAFNRMFTGQKITRVTNGTVIVERMPLKDSTNVKKKLGGNNPQMKLDHTIPLELGGSNDESNLKLVTTSQWSKYTPVENALGKALKQKKITKDRAQKLIVDFKSGKMTEEAILNSIK